MLGFHEFINNGDPGIYFGVAVLGNGTINVPKIRLEMGRETMELFQAISM